MRNLSTFAANLTNLQMKKLVSLAALAIFIMSCSGDDTSPTNNTTEDVVLLKHYTTADGQSWNLEYNGTKLTKLQNNNSDYYQQYILYG